MVKVKNSRDMFSSSLIDAIKDARKQHVSVRYIVTALKWAIKQIEEDKL